MSGCFPDFIGYSISALSQGIYYVAIAVAQLRLAFGDVVIF